MKIKFFLSFLFVNLLLINCNHASSWKNYPYSNSKSEIEFPRDEGTHNIKFGLEWWYYVIHGYGVESGDRYSILVTYFNINTRFFTVTNIDKNIRADFNLQGKLDVTEGQLHLRHESKFGTDTLQHRTNKNGDLIPFEYEARAFGKDSEISVRMKSKKRPLMVVDTGYMPIGSYGHSWYYSLTRLEVSGTVNLNGVTEEIKGTGWMDHQWGPFLVSPLELKGLFESYEWFCIQLDNGADIMISDIFNRKHQIPMKFGYGQVEYIDAHGVSEYTVNREFSRTKFWKDPLSKKVISMEWVLRVPLWDTELKLVPTSREQMVRIPFSADFWEGSLNVEGHFFGERVKGLGFGELVHKYQVPKIRLKRVGTYRVNKEISINWKLINSDQGNPLHYSVVLEDMKGNKNVLVSRLVNKSLKFSWNIPGTYKLYIVGKSVDESIIGKSKPRKIQILK